MVFSLAFYPSFLAREHDASSSSIPTILAYYYRSCVIVWLPRESVVKVTKWLLYTLLSIFSYPRIGARDNFWPWSLNLRFVSVVLVSRRRFVTRHAQTTPLLFLRSREFMQNERRVESFISGEREILEKLKKFSTNWKVCSKNEGQIQFHSVFSFFLPLFSFLTLSQTDNFTRSQKFQFP